MSENLNIEKKTQYLLIKALNSKDSIKLAAKALGVSNRQVFILMAKYDIVRDPRTKIYSLVAEKFEKDLELLEETHRFGISLLAEFAVETGFASEKISGINECLETLYRKAVLNLKKVNGIV